MRYKNGDFIYHPRFGITQFEDYQEHPWIETGVLRCRVLVQKSYDRAYLVPSECRLATPDEIAVELVKIKLQGENYNVQKW